jgi:hypothetical protein
MLLDSVQAIRFVAERLDTLTERMVFLGGATLGLFVTELGAAPPRATKDVDLVVEITMPEYLDNSFRSELLNRGFREVTDEGVLCRWEIEGREWTSCPLSPGSLVSAIAGIRQRLPRHRATSFPADRIFASFPQPASWQPSSRLSPIAVEATF